MERLIVLGTGNAQAIHCYNTCYAMQKGEEYFLVDAGGGTVWSRELMCMKMLHCLFHRQR